MNKELKKCITNPYYCVTTYGVIETTLGIEPIKIELSEEEFNNYAKQVTNSIKTNNNLT
jgi:hypothetical protein